MPKQGDYYYRTNLICCFSEDEDYGLEPTFDENGRTEQWFTAYYDSISEDSWNVLILQLWAGRHVPAPGLYPHDVRQPERRHAL